MKPLLATLCLIAITDLTEIIDGIPRDCAWAAKEAIAKRRAWVRAYRRHRRSRL